MSRPRNSFIARLLPVEPQLGHVLALPVDPHCTWIAVTGVIPGLNRTAVPSDVDFNTPRVGRAIEVQGNAGEQVNVTKFALYPAHPNHPHVPPYPGQCPIGLRSAFSPDTCHTDGSLARWDPRWFPQLYIPGRPWLVFHLDPYNLSVTGIQDNIEVLPVTAFFSWNAPGTPTRGGDWRKGLLGEVFQSRAAAEWDLHQTIERFEQVIGKPCNWAPYDLPWYDTLQDSIALQWTSWQEGRDALGRTLLYIAEIKAMSRWLRVHDRYHCMMQVESAEVIVDAPQSDLMGTWGATIQSSRDWEILEFGGVPIYVISEIPPEHPLWNQTVPGNLDADERFRCNLFDSLHGRPNPFWRMKLYQFETIEALGDEPRSTQIPPELFTPRAATPRSCRDDVINWKAYLFLDPDIQRHVQSGMTRNEYDTIRKQYEDRALFRFLAPTDRVLTLALDPHPVMRVLPDKRGYGITHILEVTLYPQRNVWYAKYLEAASVEHQTRYCDYHFYYPRERTVVYSDYPYPGRHYSVGRQSGAPKRPSKPRSRVTDEVVTVTALPLVWTDSRVYYRPGYEDAVTEPLFTWEPVPGIPQTTVRSTGLIRTSRPGVSYHPYSGRPRQSNELQLQIIATQVSKSPLSISHYPAPLINNGSAHLELTPEIAMADSAHGHSQGDDSSPRHVPSCSVSNTGVNDDLRNHSDNAMVIFDPIFLTRKAQYTTTSSALVLINAGRYHRLPISDVVASQLIRQRQLLQDQILRRLFKPPSTLSDNIVPWVIPLSTNARCYPVRLGNLDGSITARAVIDMVLAIAPSVEITIYSVHHEVDTSQALELGMRYAEDALLLWLTLHGLRISDRILEVYPVISMTGKGYVVPAANFRERSLQRRKDYVIELIRLSTELPPSSANARADLDAMLVEINKQSINTQLPCQSKSGLHDDNLLIRGIVSTCTPPLGYSSAVEATDNLQMIGLGKVPTQYRDNSALLPIATGSLALTDNRNHRQIHRSAAGRLTNSRHQSVTDRSTCAELDDSNQKRMFVQERKSLKRAVQGRAEILTKCWKPFDLPSFQFSRGKGPNVPMPLTDFFAELWDWQDQCVRIMQETRGRMPEKFDYAPFEDAFGSLARLNALFGQEYKECLVLWNQRYAPIEG